MKRFFFIRHGRQNATLCNVDVPLSEEGRLQAALLRDRLEKIRFDAAYSSTLMRAVETADIINEKQGLKIERRKELGEIDWGDLTGLDIKRMYEDYGSFLEHRSSRKEDVRFPGGENAEDVFSRCLPVIREIEKSGYEKILIVTHGGLIRSMISGLLGLGFKDSLAFAKVLENTSITEFCYYEDSGLYTLERLNDAAHLACNPELMRSAWSLYR